MSTNPQTTTQTREVDAATAVTKRIILLGRGTIGLPQATQAALEEVNSAIVDCARRIEAAMKTAKDHDRGRLIHTIDLLREAKDSATVALQLPHI